MKSYKKKRSRKYKASAPIDKKDFHEHPTHPSPSLSLHFFFTSCRPCLVSELRSNVMRCMDANHEPQGERVTQPRPRRDPIGGGRGHITPNLTLSIAFAIRHMTAISSTTEAAIFFLKCSFFNEGAHYQGFSRGRVIFLTGRVGSPFSRVGSVLTGRVGSPFSRVGSVLTGLVGSG